MLEIDDVVVGYGDTTVLRGVSVAVPPGAVVAVLGANGAGKSTLLRTASGLLRPWQGDVRVDGKTLNGHGPAAFAKAGVCHVPEGRGIFRSLTVRENILLQTRGSAALAMDKATDVFPVLGKRMKQTAGSLSGGEQQMLALTRAYVSEPSVVLLDEVSLGLAPKIVDEIFAFLARLAAEGVALLLIEQYVVRALELANFVFILNRGNVVFAGEPSELDAKSVFEGYLGHH